MPTLVPSNSWSSKAIDPIPPAGIGTGVHAGAAPFATASAESKIIKYRVATSALSTSTRLSQPASVLNVCCAAGATVAARAGKRW